MGNSVRDPFGWEDLGGPIAGRVRTGRLCKANGPIKRAAKTDGRRTLISRFRRLREEADWWACRDLANELLMLDLPQHERSEALFALGYAQENLGNKHQAIVAYRKALNVEADHEKAARRLARLEKADYRSLASPRQR